MLVWLINHPGVVITAMAAAGFLLAMLTIMILAVRHGTPSK